MNLTNTSICSLKGSLLGSDENDLYVTANRRALKETLELMEDIVNQLRNSQTIMIGLGGDNRLTAQRKVNQKTIQAYVGEENVRELINKLTRQ